MGQGPFGTSGLCPNTEHWIKEGNAAIEQYHEALEVENESQQADGYSVYAQISPSTQGLEANTVAGFEVIYNRNSHDLSLFVVLGAGGGASIGESIDVMITEVYNIGDDNLAYSGNAVSVTGGAAYYLGPAKGAGFTSSLEPNTPYTNSNGLSIGIGAHSNISLIENIPIYSVNLNSGSWTFHAYDYLYNNDFPVQNGWVTSPLQQLSTTLQGWLHGNNIAQ